MYNANIGKSLLTSRRWKNMLPFSAPNQLILIGPSGVGKTTIGTQLARMFGCPFHSLDTAQLPYLVAAGYDGAYAETLRASPVPFARYHYRRTFFPAALDGFLRDYPHGILELGAGHPIAPDSIRQAQITARLAPYPRVLLLLPTADLQESIALIRARLGEPESAPGINQLLTHDTTYLTLAKYTVYTHDKTVNNICDEIRQLFKTPCC
jgi:DNA polymerase III delta prime subunit